MVKIIEELQPENNKKDKRKCFSLEQTMCHTHTHNVKVLESSLVVTVTESSLKVPDLRSGWATAFYS